MRVLRVPLFVLLSVVVCCFVFAPKAQAQDCGERCVENPTDGFGGWQSLDPMGPEGFNPPVMTRCIADGASNRACRICDSKANPNGTYSYFCGWTQRSAACDCQYPTLPSCAGTGSCTYV